MAGRCRAFFLLRAGLRASSPDSVPDAVAFFDDALEGCPEAIHFVPGRPDDGFPDIEEIDRSPSRRRVRATAAGTIRDIIAGRRRVDVPETAARS